MTIEKLLKGQQLTQQIDKLKKECGAWGKASYFGEGMQGVTNMENYVDLPTKHIPFDIVQAIVIKKYESEISELQNEFNNL